MAEQRDDAGALAGLRVVAFESRRASEIEHLLARHGATVISAPALREVPIDENAAALELVRRLEERTLDAVILLTGVGTRALVEAVQASCPTERLVALLGAVPIVARGPKPVAALRALGLAATVRAPEPNTWRELLDALDRELPVRGLRVAVQEYGKSNDALLDGLRARGADVLRVPVYRWALPHDVGPLRAAIARLVARDAEVAVFTTAVQLDHLLQVAAAMPAGVAALEDALRDDVVVAAIGPTAAEALREAGLPADLVPEHPKLGYLVAEIAGHARRALDEKRARRHRDA
jgi:uroporphyrinogen-III synthase